MRHFILTIFFSFLASGNLQTVDNVFNYQMPPADNVLGPEVSEETIYPVHAYQTFGGNFYGTARRSIIPKPCIRQSNSQDISFEQNSHIGRNGYNVQDNNMQLAQAMNSQQERHISNVQNVPFQPPINNQQERLMSNVQDVPFQPPVNTQLQKQYSNTQYMSYQQPPNHQHINQVEEPSPTRRSSLSETENKPEINMDSTILRTQAIEDGEASDVLRSGYSDEMGESLRSSDNFGRMESSDNPESTTNSETEPPTTTDSPNNNESVENSESISQEKTTFKTKEPLEENSSQEDRIVKNIEEKYHFEVTSDIIVSPDTPPRSNLREQSYQHDISNVQCSGKNPSDIQLHEAPRRFLTGSNNNPVINQNSVSSKTVGRSGTEQDNNLYNFGNSQTINSGKNFAANTGVNPSLNPSYSYDSNLPSNSATNQGSKYSNSVLRTNSNPENQMRQNKDIPKVISVIRDPSDTSDKSSSNAKNLERSGNLHHYDKNSMYNDPAHGQGISFLKRTTLMLMDYDRICYACSTANNPTCKKPDRKTSVKYCRKGDNACVTKTFGSGSTLTTIRDCARSCSDTEIPGLSPNFKSCSICYSDLCNAAVNVHTSILILPTIVLITLGKLLA